MYAKLEPAVICGRQATAGYRHKPAVIVVITAGSVTSQINFWFSDPRTGSEGSTLLILLIPTVMRPAVKCYSIVVMLGQENSRKLVFWS